VPRVLPGANPEGPARGEFSRHKRVGSGYSGWLYGTENNRILKVEVVHFCAFYVHILKFSG